MTARLAGLFCCCLLPHVCLCVRAVQAEKNAVTSSFLSGYLDVALGVIWERINNCGSKDYQHGIRALKLLELLLLQGSLRVHVIALSFLPILRHLIMPTLHSAAIAGEWAAVCSGMCVCVFVALLPGLIALVCTLNALMQAGTATATLSKSLTKCHVSAAHPVARLLRLWLAWRQAR